MQIPSRVLGGVVAALVCCASPVVADTLTWDGSAGDWDTDASWTPTGAEPTSVDDVVIDAGNVGVTLPDEAASQVTVGAAGTLDVNGGALTTGEFHQADGGTLFVRNFGSLVNTDGFVGANAASTASVLGFLTRWSTTGDLTIGGAAADPSTLTVDFGAILGVGDAAPAWTTPAHLVISDHDLDGNAGGHLRLTSGSSINNGNILIIGAQLGEAGFVDITGAGSHWMNSRPVYVGYGGSGRLDLQAGASMVASAARLANGVGSTGAVMINGADTDWTVNGSVRIGYRGDASLRIEDGGTFSSIDSTIGLGLASTGNVVVTGAGSAWTSSGFLWVGDGGQATLRIEDGGSVSSLAADIGDHPGSTGVATVTGTGSTWTNAGHLGVGSDFNGTLNIESGGVVTSDGGTLGNFVGSTGVVTVTGAGSAWNNTGGLTVGFRGHGTLNIEAGGTVTQQNADIGSEAGSTGTVTVAGPGSTFATTNILALAAQDESRLIVQPGGLVTVGLVFALGSNGVLELGLAGVTPGTGFGTLDVEELASLGGTLDVSLIDGFTPVAGDTFTFLTAGNRVDHTFDAVLLPTLDDGLSFDVVYHAQSVALKVLAAGITGDYNASGQVEQGDLDLVLQNWGVGAAALPGAWIEQRPTEGIVDQAELDAVLQNWGGAASPHYRGTGVPEPMAACVLLITLGLRRTSSL